MTRDQLLRRYGAVDYLRNSEGDHAMPGEQLGVAVELLRAIASRRVDNPAALAATFLDLMGAMPEDEEREDGAR